MFERIEFEVSVMLNKRSENEDVIICSEKWAQSATALPYNKYMLILSEDLRYHLSRTEFLDPWRYITINVLVFR